MSQYPRGQTPHLVHLDDAAFHKPPSEQSYVKDGVFYHHDGTIRRLTLLEKLCFRNNMLSLEQLERTYNSEPTQGGN